MMLFASLQSDTIVKPLDQAAQMQQAERRRSGRTSVASRASRASRTTAGHSLWLQCALWTAMISIWFPGLVHERTEGCH